MQGSLWRSVLHGVMAFGCRRAFYRLAKGPPVYARGVIIVIKYLGRCVKACTNTPAYKCQSL